MKKFTSTHNQNLFDEKKIEQIRLDAPRERSGTGLRPSMQEHFAQIKSRRHSALSKINPAKNLLSKIVKPSSITKKLDECIVGQDNAKKILAVAICTHYKRVSGKRISKSTNLMKSNILLMGGTGVGKTFLVQKIAEILEVPFYMADATTVTEAGYFGDDVESILTGLLQDAQGDTLKAQSGIVFIDEFDKIAQRHNNVYNGHSQAQQALLKLIEGKIADVPVNRISKNSDRIQLDTKNILFIFGGAFSGIEEIIRARLRGPSRIGFGASCGNDDIKGNVLENTTGEDLISFGIIPELIGRIPQVAILHPLEEEHLIHAFASSADSPARQFTELLAMEGVKLEFTKCGIKAIAAKAAKLGIGARGLFASLEQLMTNTLFIIPDDENIGRVVVDAGAVESESPRLVKCKRSRSPEFVTSDGDDERDHDKNDALAGIF